MYIKRDDLSGMQLSGNKVRKLEFLMEEALEKGHDSVITIGGIQSNHCRATAVACAYIGLQCHLILRNSAALADKDPGLTGNLLLDRMMGATIHQVSKEEYVKVGSPKLGEQLQQELQQQGLNPYVVPVGGSNARGTWGYISAAHEIIQQSEQLGVQFDDIVVACGSGGTSAGLLLGIHLSGYGAKVTSYGVCDDEDYFYDYIDGIFDDLGVGKDTRSRQLLTAIQAKGEGYAISKQEELQYVLDVSTATGVLLDPVYSGKALYNMMIDAQKGRWEGSRKVLFIHTGGLLGMFDKEQQLLNILEPYNKINRMSIQ
eukprot:TRINITY_DN16252_c1_g1_i3.p1 TRINITY_DN16252_c1_g1~~TRINITY_DN16252_c1_g1_i3.p1  ORF type:complete len:315 (-),score=41.63 TRINITY_DN16252_c1_g1_i3:406-1350(-)